MTIYNTRITLNDKELKHRYIRRLLTMACFYVPIGIGLWVRGTTRSFFTHILLMFGVELITLLFSLFEDLWNKKQHSKSFHQHF